MIPDCLQCDLDFGFKLVDISTLTRAVREIKDTAIVRTQLDTGEGIKCGLIYQHQTDILTINRGELLGFEVVAQAVLLHRELDGIIFTIVEVDHFLIVLNLVSN